MAATKLPEIKIWKKRRTGFLFTTIIKINGPGLYTHTPMAAARTATTSTCGNLAQLGTREGGIPKQILRQKSSQAWLTTTPARPATRKKECPFSTSEEVLGSSAPVVVVPLSEEPSFGGLSVKKQLTAWSLAHGARLVVTLASLYLSSIN